MLSVDLKLPSLGFYLVDVTVPASNNDALLLLKRTLNLTTFNVDCLNELGSIFEELVNVDIVLLVVYKQVLVVV